MTGAPYNPNPQAHPGLHVIAIFEAAKGLLALLAASGLELLGPAPLQRWLHGLAVHFQLDVHQGTLASLTEAISPDGVHMAAAVALLYAAMRFAEAWGLWYARAWASWLGCIGAAIYLPFDIYALVRHPGWISVTVLVVNLIVVAVLARDLHKRRR